MTDLSFGGRWQPPAATTSGGTVRQRQPERGGARQVRKHSSAVSNLAAADIGGVVFAAEPVKPAQWRAKKTVVQLSGPALPGL